MIEKTIDQKANNRKIDRLKRLSLVFAFLSHLETRKVVESLKIAIWQIHSEQKFGNPAHGHTDRKWLQR